jgi:hypothetical protein
MPAMYNCSNLIAKATLPIPPTITMPVCLTGLYAAIE